MLSIIKRKISVVQDSLREPPALDAKDIHGATGADERIPLVNQSLDSKLIMHTCMYIIYYYIKYYIYDVFIVYHHLHALHMTLSNCLCVKLNAIVFDVY